MHAVSLTPHEVREVADFMRRASGNDFTDKASLVSAKMAGLCRDVGYQHFYELWDALQGATIAAAQLRQRVIDELTTNYSYFYREQAHFDRLARLVASGEVPTGRGELRVWSAGCATGEEPYNIAMTLEDARTAAQLRTTYKVVGSDISSRAIATAQAACYDVANVSRMPPHWRSLYCARSGHQYHIRREVCAHVEFRLESVFSPRPDAPFDVVMCRNMLIYFDKASVERFCALLRGRLRPGGYLFLGHTEILGEIEGFSYVEPSLWRRDATEGDDLLRTLASQGVPRV